MAWVDGCYQPPGPNVKDDETGTERKKNERRQMCREDRDVSSKDGGVPGSKERERD